MAVPKQRHTKSRRNKRRMHLFLEAPNLSLCPKCGKEVLSHTLCWNCGLYNNREVIDVLKKLTKKERKQREKEEKTIGKEGKEKIKEKSLTWEGLSKK